MSEPLTAGIPIPSAPSRSDSILNRLGNSHADLTELRQRLHRHKERLLGNPKLEPVNSAENKADPRGFVESAEHSLELIFEEIRDCHEVLGDLESF